MKKKLGLSVLVVIGLLGFVMAAVHYGISISASNSVLNPGNVLDADSDYAPLQYATNITCPLGNFAAYSPAPLNFCNHTGSGKLIGGWEAIKFNGTISNVSNIKVKGSELNLGCTSCNVGVQVEVFKSTSTTYNSNISWSYVGPCTFADNANQTTCTLNTTGSIGHVLIGRWSGGNHRPDPAVHEVTVNN